MAGCGPAVDAWHPALVPPQQQSGWQAKIARPHAEDFTSMTDKCGITQLRPRRVLMDNAKSRRRNTGMYSFVHEDVAAPMMTKLGAKGARPHARRATARPSRMADQKVRQRLD